MKSITNNEELAAWNQRFVSFYDGVLKSWSVEFGSPTILETVIEVQDLSSPSGWSCITIRLSGVSSLKFCDSPKASYRVLSNGLHTLFEIGRVGLEFGDSFYRPESLSKLIESPFHAVGNLLEWDAKPISQ